MLAENKEDLMSWIDALSLRITLARKIKDNKKQEIVKAGWLSKRGGNNIKTWKKRYFVCTGSLLYYYSGPDSDAPLGVIPCDYASIQVADGKVINKKNCLIITDAIESFNKKHASYLLCAASEQEMEEWITALRNRS